MTGIEVIGMIFRILFYLIVISVLFIGSINKDICTICYSGFVLVFMGLCDIEREIKRGKNV